MTGRRLLGAAIGAAAPLASTGETGVKRSAVAGSRRGAERSMLEPAAGILPALAATESSETRGVASAGCTVEAGGTLVGAVVSFLACSTGAGGFFGMTSTTVATTARVAKDAANPKRGIQEKNRRRGAAGVIT